ncbi:hypothetical protein A6A04_11570 [Paramagnetospirillum marisnigri]|uniref:Uncharacterized protein n=1 Tax=Paramagnetospirillum marisnigri TaxID=1285242 RepID=A0A178MZ45_9PROT|nr:hypothetical protein A6A04_11570 [Paramagnetospirillum marisnigri]
MARSEEGKARHSLAQRKEKLFTRIIVCEISLVIINNVLPQPVIYELFNFFKYFRVIAIPHII